MPYVKKYQDSFASRNRNSNFQELKQKQDLLKENKKSYFEELSSLRYFLNKKEDVIPWKAVQFVIICGTMRYWFVTLLIQRLEEFAEVN